MCIYYSVTKKGPWVVHIILGSNGRGGGLIFEVAVLYTARPLNSGHTGGQNSWNVNYREIVPILEVELLAMPLILSSLIGFYAEGYAYKKLNQQISIKTCSKWVKIDKIREWTDYLSNKH